MSEPTMTTAQVLGSLRAQLIELGFPDGVADQIAIDAARAIITDSGLAVRQDVEAKA